LISDRGEHIAISRRSIFGIYRQVVTTLQMMPNNEGVTIPLFPKYINTSGEFVSDEAQTKAATIMLGERQKWASL